MRTNRTNTRDEQDCITERASHFGLSICLHAIEPHFRRHYQPVVALDCTKTAMPSNPEMEYLAAETTALDILNANKVKYDLRHPKSFAVCLPLYNSVIFWKNIVDEIRDAPEFDPETAIGTWSCQRLLDKAPVCHNTLKELIGMICANTDLLVGANFIHQ